MLSKVFLFYFCSENTKNVLLAVSHIHLNKENTGYALYASDFTTLNPRILLSGPAGLWYLACVVPVLLLGGNIIFSFWLELSQELKYTKRY